MRHPRSNSRDVPGPPLFVNDGTPAPTSPTPWVYPAAMAISNALYKPPVFSDEARETLTVSSARAMVPTDNTSPTTAYATVFANPRLLCFVFMVFLPLKGDSIPLPYGLLRRSGPTKQIRIKRAAMNYPPRPNVTGSRVCSVRILAAQAWRSELIVAQGATQSRWRRCYNRSNGFEPRARSCSGRGKRELCRCCPQAWTAGGFGTPRGSAVGRVARHTTLRAQERQTEAHHPRPGVLPSRRARARRACRSGARCGGDSGRASRSGQVDCPVRNEQKLPPGH